MLASEKAIWRDPHETFLRFVTTYVILLALSAALGSGIFRALSYLVALLMLFVLAVRSSGRKGGVLDGMEYVLPLLLYYYGLTASIIYNYENLDWPATIKLSLAPIFLLIGAKIEARRASSVALTRRGWLLFGLVILLPVAVLALQLLKGVNVLARGADFSIFANRNNAGLFAVALLGLFTVYARRTPTNALIYMAVGASFGTLGVLLAIIFSLVLLVAKRENLLRYAIGAAVVAAAMFVLAINDVWIFARFKPVIGTLELLIDPRVHLPTMSYERLYHILDTTDLSLAFRIKHWYDLFEIFTTAPLFNWFFGMGVGASTRLSLAHTLPHNDFLKVLFECGIVTFIGFVTILAVMLTRLGRRWETVPFLAISLYMISENLIDNFLAMSIFYYAGGTLIYRLRHAPRQEVKQVGTANSTNVTYAANT